MASSSALVTNLPTLVMRSPANRTFAAKAGRPLPSTTRAPTMTRDLVVWGMRSALLGREGRQKASDKRSKAMPAKRSTIRGLAFDGRSRVTLSLRFLGGSLNFRFQILRFQMSHYRYSDFRYSDF